MNIKHHYDTVIYLLQGGGALGAYQVGVCEGLLNNNLEPDWVIGTSIGAINAAIIAGNKPENRVSKLKTFWQLITHQTPGFIVPTKNESLRICQKLMFAQWTLLFGQPHFFKPRFINPWIECQSSPDKLSYYDTSVLQDTLCKVIDFDLLNSKKVRLTLNAVDVESGELTTFDNTKVEISPLHVMASGALPTGFPAVKIDDRYYWDGGIISNTPLLGVLKEKVAEKLLCFIVDLFAISETNPTTMLDVIKRQKDLEFSSRYRELLAYFCEVHRLRHALREICKEHKEYESMPFMKDIHFDGHPCALNIVRFHYRDKADDLWSKDFEFSSQSLHEHYQSGNEDVLKAFEDTAWLKMLPEGMGIALHEY